MEAIPLPMDIINKIQLYVSTPEADMVRTQIAMDHTYIIARMIDEYWFRIKWTFIDGFQPKWDLYKRCDERLKKLYDRFVKTVCTGRGKDAWMKEALIIVRLADTIFNTPP
jgi:hypothetical protein